MAERIGFRRCPLCGNGRAHVSLSKKGLVCVTCNGCKLQAFARGPQADELLRQGVQREPDAPAPTPAPAAKPAPAPVQPKPAPTPAPATTPALKGWGLLG
jgi:hypothetical protein